MTETNNPLDAVQRLKIYTCEYEERCNVIHIHGGGFRDRGYRCRGEIVDNCQVRQMYKNRKEVIGKLTTFNKSKAKEKNKK